LFEEEITMTGLQKTRLTKLLAIAVGAGEDFGEDHLNVLISIGQGMFWSHELDEAARDLAYEVDKTLEVASHGQR